MSIVEFQGSPLYPIYCRGCGQQMGWASSQPRSGINVSLYCSAVCGYDIPLGENEERNDLLRNLIAAGWSTSRAVEYFGLTHQRVNQIKSR